MILFYLNDVLPYLNKMMNDVMMIVGLCRQQRKFKPRKLQPSTASHNHKSDQLMKTVAVIVTVALHFLRC